MRKFLVLPEFLIFFSLISKSDLYFFHKSVPISATAFRWFLPVQFKSILDNELLKEPQETQEKILKIER